MHNPVTVLPMGGFAATDPGGLYQYGGQIDAAGWKLFGGNVPLLLAAPGGSNVKLLVGAATVLSAHGAGVDVTGVLKPGNVELPVGGGLGVGVAPGGKPLLIAATEQAAQLKSGLQLGATPGATLNDYAVGSWTPNLAWGTGGSFGYVAQGGTYTRLGKLVVVSFNISLNAHTAGTGGLVLQGLPFTARSVTQIAPLFHQQITPPASSRYDIVEVQGGSTQCRFWSVVGGAGAANWQNTNVTVGATATLWGTLKYEIA